MIGGILRSIAIISWNTEEENMPIFILGSKGVTLVVGGWKQLVVSWYVSTNIKKIMYAAKKDMI